MKSWLLFIVLWAPPVMATDLESAVPQMDPVSSTTLGKITLGLGFILLLIFVLAWVLKKMQLTPNADNRLINIVSAVSVGQRDRIALIEVGDEQFVVGITPGRIEKLHSMKKRVERPHGENLEQNQFYDKFTQLLKKGQSDGKRDQ